MPPFMCSLQEMLGRKRGDERKKNLQFNFGPGGGFTGGPHDVPEAEKARVAEWLQPAIAEKLAQLRNKREGGEQKGERASKRPCQ